MMNFVKKYWFLFLLAALAVLLTIAWVVGKTKGPEGGLIDNDPDLPKVTYPVIPGSKIPNNTKITINTTVVNNNPLYIYRAIFVKISDQALQEIAQLLGFPAEPSRINHGALGKEYFWFRDEFSLSIKPSPIEIRVVKEGDPEIDQGISFPTTVELTQIISSMVNIIGVNTANIKFITHQPKTIDSIIELNIDPVIDNIRITDANQLYRLITLQAERGSLFSFYWRLGFTDTQNTTTIPYLLKDIDGIKNSLEKEGVIVQIGTPDHVPISTSVSSVLINNIEVVFFNEASSDLVYPMYVAKGVGETPSGNQDVVIYLPAVKSKYITTTRLAP